MCEAHSFHARLHIYIQPESIDAIKKLADALHRYLYIKSEGNLNASCPKKRSHSTHKYYSLVF